MSDARLTAFLLGMLWTAVVLAALGFLIFDPGPQTSGGPEWIYSLGAWDGLWWLAYFAVRDAD